MNQFEIVLIIGISISILLSILVVISLIQFLNAKSNIKKLNNCKPKNRKKKKRWKKELNFEENKKSKKLRVFLFSFLGTLLVGGGTAYAKYYQATVISDQDTDNIVYSYYLLEQIEDQIKNIDKSNDKKTSDNIHNLAVSISSFASKKGSDRSKKDAQILLNQYYARVGQFGVNISSQDFDELKKDKEKQADYLDDIKNVKKTQKKVIQYYKIDESSLKEKK